MVDLSDPQTQVLLVAGLGAIVLFYLAKDEQEETVEEKQSVTLAPTGNGKEASFLRFNQDGVYGNLLATEEHFRNLKSDVNFNQCAVKHLALGANHADEAVSHTIAVGDTSASKNYVDIRNKMRDLQHDIQDGKVTSEQGITRIRAIKAEFESFNPSFDTNKCKACQIA